MVLFRICLPVVFLGGAVCAQTLPPLTRASEIRRLTPEQAALGYPVRLQGVITDDVPAPDFFVQDRNAGIYVEGRRQAAFEHHIHDLVELIGVTGPGRFAPVVKEISYKVLRTGASLPTTRIYEFSELANGVMDSQWIKIRGIIRSASIDRTTWPETTIALTVDSGGGQFKARIPLSKSGNLAPWIGREALFSGVCGSLFNQERQFIGVLLYVPAIEFVSIETSAEAVPIPELLRFSPQQRDSRVRVSGVVSYQDPGKLFCLQAGNRGLRVMTQESTALSVGDQVDVLGWPTVGESAPVLTSSTVKVIRHGLLPRPVNFDFRSDWQHYDGALVTLDADLLDIASENGEKVLRLRHDSTVFTAPLKGALAYSRRSIPVPGSRLQLTGVCLVRNGGLWRVPQSFQILLRSTKDMKVLSAPSLWNLRSASLVLGATLGMLLTVVVWMVVVRQRLKSQVQIMREKLQRGAVLEERNRIARELHDTLEQDLTGITLHLDLAADCFHQAPEQARHALDTARHMSRRSMVEARRSVWDLRSHLLEKGTLASALVHSVEPLSSRNLARVELQVKGKMVRLNANLEMNVLRIGQEAITNAMKHARASKIQVALTYGVNSLGLSVTDDGCGFDEETAALSSGGHFGLLDMKERAQLLGSKLKIRSQPGRGTSVEVEIPVRSPKLTDERFETHSNPSR